MHETSVATRVVVIALEEAWRRGFRRVRAVRLRVGALWGSEPESLAFHVRLLGQGTPLANAILEIERVPIVARCHSCGASVKDPRLEDPGFLHTLAHGPILVEALLRCADCGEAQVVIDQGRELEIIGMAAAANSSQAG